MFFFSVDDVKETFPNRLSTNFKHLIDYVTFIILHIIDYRTL